MIINELLETVIISEENGNELPTLQSLEKTTWERRTGSDLKKEREKKKKGRKEASKDEKKMYIKPEPNDTFSKSNYLV